MDLDLPIDLHRAADDSRDRAAARGDVFVARGVLVGGAVRDAAMPQAEVEAVLGRLRAAGLAVRVVDGVFAARAPGWALVDRAADVASARRAGLRPILVQTGAAGLDGAAWVDPDATVPGLAEAVSFVLDGHPRLLATLAPVAAALAPGDLVLVGGQSRSGKSTVAAALREAIAARGGSAFVVTADRFLRDAADRGPGVLGRFDMAALQSVADALADPHRRPSALVLDGYDKRTRTRVPAMDSIATSPADVAVLEGVPVLALTSPACSRVHRIHVAIDEEQRRRRVLHEYRVRGLTDADASAVYQARRADEWPVVQAAAATADTTISPWAPAPARNPSYKNHEDRGPT